MNGLEDRLVLLSQRVRRIYDSLYVDPNRPFWQMELISIATEFADVVEVLYSTSSASADTCASIEKRVSLLETRYSELLYQLSSMRKDG